MIFKNTDNVAQYIFQLCNNYYTTMRTRTSQYMEYNLRDPMI